MKFSATVIGHQAIKEMLSDAPDLYYRNVRGEAWRFVKRVRAAFVREQLKGPTSPTAIKWRGPTGPNATGRGSKRALGGNAKGWVAGKRRDNLTAFFRISRFLVWHSEGTTGRYAVPGRLDVESVFNRLVPDFIRRTDIAMGRASDQLTNNANKKFRRSLGRSGAAFRVAA